MSAHHATTQISESLGRYVIAIYSLQSEGEAARSKDIAELVGVSRPSVTGALQKLDRAGLISYEPYGEVTLTRAGEREARSLLLKHRATYDFLRTVLGLPEDRAEAVSGSLEQALPADVLCRLVQFNDFYRRNPDANFEWSPTCANLCTIMYGLKPTERCHPGMGRAVGESTVPDGVPTR